MLWLLPLIQSQIIVDTISPTIEEEAEVITVIIEVVEEVEIQVEVSLLSLINLVNSHIISSIQLVLDLRGLLVKSVGILDT